MKVLLISTNTPTSLPDTQKENAFYVRNLASCILMMSAFDLFEHEIYGRSLVEINKMGLKNPIKSK